MCRDIQWQIRESLVSSGVLCGNCGKKKKEGDSDSIKSASSSGDGRIRRTKASKLEEEGEEEEAMKMKPMALEEEGEEEEEKGNRFPRGGDRFRSKDGDLDERRRRNTPMTLQGSFVGGTRYLLSKNHAFNNVEAQISEKIRTN